MMELSGPSHPPLGNGKPKQLVVLLHGYGSNGDDLIGLAPFFAQALPEAEFLSPNAPFPCELSPFGFQWFGLEDRSPGMKLGGVKVAAQILARHFGTLDAIASPAHVVRSAPASKSAAGCWRNSNPAAPADR